MPDKVPVDLIAGFCDPGPDISVSMLRLDLLHPVVSGNKWFKLRYNLAAAVAEGIGRVITFGGAYSNHLVAAAAAAQAAGLHSVGIVRGFHAQGAATPTLDACRAYGMQLHFVSREDYAHKDDPVFLQALKTQYGPARIIPEGGDNEEGCKGAGDIAGLIPVGTTHVCLPVGTGTTFAGLRNALHPSIFMTGFTAMKGGAYLQEGIAARLTAPADNWDLETAFHFGGFARATPELMRFLQVFYAQHGIPLDIVYTGKMMYGLQALIGQGRFPAGARVVAIHTGGLQGNPPGLFAV